MNWMILLLFEVFIATKKRKAISYKCPILQRQLFCLVDKDWAPSPHPPSLQDTSISHLFLLTYIMIIIWHLSLTVRVSFSSSGVLLALFHRRLFIFIVRFCSFSPSNCSILIWQKFHILSQSTQLIKCARVIFFLPKQEHMGILACY